MPRRPDYRTPAYIHPGNPNPELLRKVRTPFGCFTEGDGRTQCESVARSTGERCRCNAVKGTTRCKVHGGMWRLEETIAKQGPHIAKHSQIDRKRSRQYDIACAYALDELSPKLAQSEKGQHHCRSLSARGRKLRALAQRELNR